jgi:hypothetical protein
MVKKLASFKFFGIQGCKIIFQKNKIAFISTMGFFADQVFRRVFITCQDNLAYKL